MVITSFRSGSTFLGDLLQQADNRSFYFYEPLHGFTLDARVETHTLPTVNRLVQHLLQCNYKEEPRHVTRILKPRSPFFLTRNHFLSKVCDNTYPTDPACADVQLLQETCRRSRVQIMKFTRLNLADALKLDLPAGTKILYLQRDPRAIYNSRKSLGWCRKKECSNISVICEERNNDLRALQRARNDKIIVTRFEDMALNTTQESERLFNALGLRCTKNVKKFLQSHTEYSGKATNVYSTKRDSSAVVSQWRTQLSRAEIMQLQESCNYVIKNAGYDFIS